MLVLPTRPDHGIMAGVFLFLSTATRSPNLPNCPQGSALPDWCQGAWGTRELPRLGGSLEGMMGAPWKGIKGDFWGRGLRTAGIGWIELDKVWEDDVARVIGDISYFNFWCMQKGKSSDSFPSFAIRVGNVKINPRKWAFGWPICRFQLVPVGIEYDWGKSFRPPELHEHKSYLATKVDSWCLGVADGIWTWTCLLFWLLSAGWHEKSCFECGNAQSRAR